MKNKPNKCKTCKYGDSPCDWCMTDPDGSLNYEPKDDYDPIHAAGGCRCAECKFASEDGGYEYPGQAETHVNCTIRLTRNHRAVIMPKDGHCSCGERKDGKTHDNQ